jgi:hypothetical protein
VGVVDCASTVHNQQRRYGLDPDMKVSFKSYLYVKITDLGVSSLAQAKTGSYEVTTP